MIDKWLDIYAKQTVSELPALEGRLKTLETDMQTNTKRVDNLVARLSDLPQEISADPIYEQIKQLNKKIGDLKAARENLKSRAPSQLNDPRNRPGSPPGAYTANCGCP